MAKKLTKAQIAKNPTKAINSGKMKMRKQEVPFGGIGKAAAKVVGKVIGKKTVAKGGSRQSLDVPISSSSAKKYSLMPGKSPNMNYRYGKDTSISKNVKIKDTVSPSGKSFIRGGAVQVINQNARLTTGLSKAEVKANARGLKAANKKVSKKNAGQNASKMKIDIIKNATPERANRTRLGKSALKSK
jgi:hypothetical protein